MDEITRDYRSLPESEEELLALIADIFREYQGKIVELRVRAGQPVVFEYLAEGKPGRGEPRPYDILRQGSIEEWSQDVVGGAQAVVFSMLQGVVDRGYHPVCLLAREAAVWPWLGCEPDSLIAGYPVYLDERLPKRTLLVAGSPRQVLGTGGLAFGLKHSWGV